MADNIAIVEFGKGHAECLYSQVKMLERSGLKVHLLCKERLEERVRQFDGVYQFQFFSNETGYLDTLQNVLKVHRYLNANGIHKVIINTFSGTAVKLFMLMASRLEVYGVLHDVRKLRRSQWYRWISKRMGGYFVLNDYLLKEGLEENLRIQSMYPIFFPTYQSAEIGKDETEFWVSIPGHIEYKRRNYLGLLEELSDDLDPRVKFVLLGNINGGDGRDFLERLGEFRTRFITFDNFIEDRLFHSYIAKSDLIMPLLGTNQRYRTAAVSGSFNLAFGHRKPMLVEGEYMQTEDFQNSAIGFFEGNLVKTLNTLANDAAILTGTIRKISNYEKFSFEHQRKKFVKFLSAPR